MIEKERVIEKQRRKKRNVLGSTNLTEIMKANEAEICKGI
jgi:hypothetical protein